MSLSKEFPILISELKELMSTRLAKAALRKVRETVPAHSFVDTKFVGEAFTWNESPQGHIFWSRICSRQTRLLCRS